MMTKPTVLVVDDDDTILSVVEATLKQNGYTPILAHDGKEGLKMAIEQSPDAIILDRKMPEMDGNEVLEALQKDPKTKDVPVMMLTGEKAIADVANSLTLGAKDYIVKPFDNENFLIRLKNIIGKRN